MISKTPAEAARYSNRYAAAVYVGNGRDPVRAGLMQRQYYVGRILEGGRFHVLMPDRLCSVSEFQNFRLVSRRWRALLEFERALLIELYHAKKLQISGRDSSRDVIRRETTAALMETGYVRWAEPEMLELTPLGAAEVAHHLLNLDAGDDISTANGGIRIQHVSPQEHEITLGRCSSLTVNIDGMVVRVVVLPDSGAIIRVDHDSAHRMTMNYADPDRRFAQTYIDRTAVAGPQRLGTGEKQ